MKKFIVSIVLQVLVVLFVFPIIDKDFGVRGDFKDALVIVLIFIAMNFAARRLILILTLGVGAIIYYLTLGLAGLILNAVVLYGVNFLFPQMFHVPGFAAAFLGGLCLSIANYIGGK